MQVEVLIPFTLGDKRLSKGDKVNMSEKEAMVYGKQLKVMPVGAEAKAEVKAAAKAGQDSKTTKK